MLENEKNEPAVAADKILKDAVKETLEIVLEVVEPNEIGEHLGYRADGERLLTHFFAANKAGYQGWHWAVTVSRVPRARRVTVSEIDLLPGKGALLAPEWVPWEERLRPSDVSPSDVLPYRQEDSRLTLIRDSKYGSDEPPLSRVRTLSQEGIDAARTRWHRRSRAKVNKTDSKSTCASCGFLVALRSELGQSFGVCSNEWSGHDGRLVPLTYACGAHSETDVQETGSQWNVVPPRVNELDLEIISDL
ncbi:MULTISPECIES: DUF3027 domain-containing protein [Actinomycetaceae]|uniref:DUF3027 domain-containing protein n=1 Tax=Actinomycetaceae TaxID=2049 RepID=UPI001D7B8A6D|nr:MULTISPECIES: DUF3027 domain-containing protein [Actinomycetaceae]MBS6102538.1 DUF3027 domain-containing protein [Actinomyces sp.]MDK7142941.1 DUF3027 domain-containing protein [Gleimia europaea]MDU7239751.1 DUF3027 domain-containing protein [Actinomyces sp.]